MTNCIYSNFIEAKDGSLIPLLKSGKSLESRYNPHRDAENIINALEEDYKFFIILGIGSGILIKKLFEKFNSCKIIAVEISSSDFNFLNSNSETKKILSNKNLILADIENIDNLIINNYLPAKYGNIKILEQKNWIAEIKDFKDNLYNRIQKAINIIAADFSVQAHFGKIWTCNILNNIKLIAQNKIKTFPDINKKKTALIIAAGPGLDSKINYIQNKQDNFYIISTDTAFSSLIKNNIYADIVVSLDAQNISYNHFIKTKNISNTCFLFDLCGNSSAAKHLIENGFNTYFFVSGHPLSAIFNYFSKESLPKLESGAGTVTMAALDLAVKLNFEKIEILGADFAYVNGKSYTKGTYLDCLYSLNSNILNSIEKKFDNLLYRTDLISISDNKYTTQILDAYKKSLIDYFNTQKLKYNYINDIYYIENIKNEHSSLNYRNFDFNFSGFLSFLKNLNNSEIETALLPYVSWLRNNPNNKNLDYEEFLKLAHSFIVSYN